MEATESFKAFLKEIRLSGDLREESKLAHEDLRARIEADERLKPILVDTFLQGSYRRHTGVMPEIGKKADVDVVIVTNLDRFKVSAKEALAIFEPFLEEHYPGAYELQSRSWGITVGNIKLDLVPTSAPSEATQKFFSKARESGIRGDFVEQLTREGLDRIQKAAGIEDWKNESLWIPDRDAAQWDETNPLEQIAWTIEKNANTDGHYVNVVKVSKWWRVGGCPGKHPKGYPLEHLVGANCPDGVTSVAEEFTLTMEAIVANYVLNRLLDTVPHLADHGVPTHNVFGRITAEQFATFYDAVKEMALKARAALNDDDLDSSLDAWREIFGEPFPERSRKSAAYIAPTARASMIKGNFA